MNVPEFNPGDERTRNAPLARSYSYYERLAKKAEAAWHDLGHENVRFRVVRERAGYGSADIYVVRSNLVNGLPPQ